MTLYTVVMLLLLHVLYCDEWIRRIREVKGNKYMRDIANKQNAKTDRILHRLQVRHGTRKAGSATL